MIVTRVEKEMKDSPRDFGFPSSFSKYFCWHSSMLLPTCEDTDMIFCLPNWEATKKKGGGEKLRGWSTFLPIKFVRWS